MLTNVISTLSTVNHELHSSSSPDAKAKLEEGKKIISQISALKSDMGKNKVMECVDRSKLPVPPLIIVDQSLTMEEEILHATTRNSLPTLKLGRNGSR